MEISDFKNNRNKSNTELLEKYEFVSASIIYNIKIAEIMYKIINEKLFKNKIQLTVRNNKKNLRRDTKYREFKHRTERIGNIAVKL